MICQMDQLFVLNKDLFTWDFSLLFFVEELKSPGVDENDCTWVALISCFSTIDRLRN